MSRIAKKVAEVGFINTLTGTIKRAKYNSLRKKYGFDAWHTSPYELRGYAQEVAKYINDRDCGDNAVIDVGCGMGEIISHVRQNKRYGYDLDNIIIDVAKKVNGRRGAEFRVGSFDEICECPEGRMQVEYMITLNFMHGSREDKWVSSYARICDCHDIRHFVVDVLPEGVNGSHSLDFTKILPECYELEDRMGPFLGERYIEVYKKKQ